MSVKSGHERDVYNLPTLYLNLSSLPMTPSLVDVEKLLSLPGLRTKLNPFPRLDTSIDIYRGSGLTYLEPSIFNVKVFSLIFDLRGWGLGDSISFQELCVGRLTSRLPFSLAGVPRFLLSGCSKFLFNFQNYIQLKLE